MLDRVNSALSAASDPANERELINLLCMGVLHRENRLASEDELAKALLALQTNAAPVA